MEKVFITGIGHSVPETILTNEDLEKIVETSDKWITERTGIKERRIAQEWQSSSYFGYKASLKALEMAKKTPEEIEMIIVATLTPDMLLPACACSLQHKLGIKGCAALDINAACSGMLYGFKIASALIKSGSYKCILLVASDVLTKFTDYKDRGTCILFGDGASACIIENKEGIFEIEHVEIEADGSCGNLLMIPAGGSLRPASYETIENREHYIKMEGNQVFKYAVNGMINISDKVVKNMGLSETDIDYLVPHQANLRIIKTLARKMKIDMKKVFINIQKYGNTSAASVGIALSEAIEENFFSSPSRILLAVFGGGFTCGAAILRYQKK